MVVTTYSAISAPGGENQKRAPGPATNTFLSLIDAQKKSSRRCRKPRGSRLDSHHLPAEKSKSLVDLFGGSNFNELGWIAGSIKHRNPLFYEKRWMAGTGGWGGRLRIKRKNWD